MTVTHKVWIDLPTNWSQATIKLGTPLLEEGQPPVVSATVIWARGKPPRLIAVREDGTTGSFVLQDFQAVGTVVVKDEAHA